MPTHVVIPFKAIVVTSFTTQSRQTSKYRSLFTSISFTSRARYVISIIIITGIALEEGVSVIAGKKRK